MTMSEELTPRVEELCRRIVTDGLPEEAWSFGLIWQVVCREFPRGRIEELEHPIELHGSVRDGAALAALGDVSGQALDSLYVIGAVVNAILILSKQGKNTLLETAHVDAAIRDEASRMNAPTHVRQILESHGTALLVEHFTAIDWQSNPTRDANAAPSRLWVEWCGSPSEESGASQFGAFDRNEMIKKFDSKRERFDLFVDETARRVLVRGDDTTRRTNLWSQLPARHLRLLYLVLHACRHSGYLPYKEIAKTALQDEFASANSVRRTKSELNEKLGGMLDPMLKPRRGMEQYEVGLISYCWIRYENAESALRGS